MDSAKSEQIPHILPLRIYLIIGAALLVMTVITVAVAQIDFGPWNLAIAMAIAAFKATLVALYFMHLKYDNKLYAVVLVVAILFLAVFIVLTMFDTMRRGDIYDYVSDPIRKFAVIYDDDGTPIPLSERGRATGSGKPEKTFEFMHGYGPLKEEVEIGELNPELAMVGQNLFQKLCVNCHALDDPEIGPPLRDVTFFRSPTFIMNQILDPEQNGEKHPDMQTLRTQYDTTMVTPEVVTLEQARALLEYLRLAAEQAPEEEEDTDFSFE